MALECSFRLGWLDLTLAAFAFLAALLAAMAFSTEPTKLRITLYHVRTIHGLLSCPYVLLRLPGANTLLTHARRTGYDAAGHCVPFAPAPAAPGAHQPDTPLRPRLRRLIFGHVATVGDRVLRVLLDRSLASPTPFQRLRSMARHVYR